jgi:DNA-binding MarR family transcriptional regulator
LGLTRQSVQRLADALESEGLSLYEPNPEHRRSPRVSLTAAGQRILTRLSAAAAKWEDPLAAQLPRAQVEEARAHIKALLQLVRQHPPQTRRRS